MSPEQRQEIWDELRDITAGADEARSGVQGYDTQFANEVRSATKKIDDGVINIFNILAKL